MSMIINPYAFGGSGPPASTWDPSLKGASIVLSNSDRDATKAGSGYQTVYGTQGRSSGRYAFEVLVVSTTDGALVIGAADKTNSAAVITSYLGDNAGAVETVGVNNFSAGRWYKRMTVGNVNGSSTGVLDFSTGQTITVDVDFAGNTISFYRNGGAFTLNPTAITSGKTYFPGVSIQSGAVARIITSGLTYLPVGSTAWG